MEVELWKKARVQACVGLMSDQRRRQWTNIKTALGWLNCSCINVGRQTLKQFREKCNNMKHLSENEDEIVRSNTCWFNVGLMWGQGQGRWPYIKTKLGEILIV